MSMTTEQAMSYLSKDDTKEDNNVVEDKSLTNDSSSEVKEESPKSEEINVDSPDNTTKIEQTDSNKAANPNNKDGQSTTEEVNKAAKAAGSDEPKTTEVEDGKKDNSDKSKKNHKEQRDYAYIREKQRRKEAEAKVKELQEALEKYKGLQSKDFKDKDGNINYDAYTNWKLQERDMQHEVERIRQEQLQQDIENDRIITERCFQGQELEDYNALIMKDGKAFADAVHEFDNKNVIFSYLDTVNEYPIVLRELMTNSDKWLPQIFRSNRYSRAVIKDPITLERNTAKVVEEILDNYYNSKNNVSKVEQSTTTANEHVNEHVNPVKNNIPIIGKQITQSGAGNSDNEVSLLSSINSINNFLRKNKRR
jgi:hypothetical protein